MIDDHLSAHYVARNVSKKVHQIASTRQRCTNTLFHISASQVTTLFGIIVALLLLFHGSRHGNIMKIV